MVMFEDLIYSGSLPYVAGFLIFFAVIFFMLNRSVFKSNRAVSTIIAVCSSLLIIWGIKETEYWQSFGDFFESLGSTTNALIFIAASVLIVLLLYKGLKSGARRADIHWGIIGIGGIFILIFFLPNIINPYYIPEILQQTEARTTSLVIGIVVLTIGIWKSRLLKLSKKVSHGEEYS